MKLEYKSHYLPYALTWQDPDSVSNDAEAENVILLVEFGEIEGQPIGKEIILALSLINNLEVNEQILYGRMIYRAEYVNKLMIYRADIIITKGLPLLNPKTTDTFDTADVSDKIDIIDILDTIDVTAMVLLMAFDSFY